MYIDEASPKLSIKSGQGAIRLVDFRAAYSSMDHNFMWGSLAAVETPLEFIMTIKQLFKDNQHALRQCGSCLFEGPTVFCGVRQR